VLTGAQRFDGWFDRTPSTSPDEFARKVGLNPDNRYVLYLCSSPFIAPDEVGFVRRWAAAIRSSSEPWARDVGLLVRPHPQNASQWQAVDLAEFGNAAIWPPAGAQPDAGEARADYFDSLAHSACIVGINTSGLLEAGIVGKSVLTVLDDDFAGTQAGTLHFQYLRWENGGLLRVAGALDEHVKQLRQVLEGRADDSEQVRRFVIRFCRPHGLDRPAAPVLAAGIEELASLGPSPAPRATAGTIARRMALYPLAGSMTAASTLLGSARWVRKSIVARRIRRRGPVRGAAEPLDTSG
jgi:hypothetical protein